MIVERTFEADRGRAMNAFDRIDIVDGDLTRTYFIVNMDRNIICGLIGCIRIRTKSPYV